VSLTVNDVNACAFSVLLIPHTLSVTTLGHNRPGDSLNIEIDVMARYAARLIERPSSSKGEGD
jgi:riboflavin synthase